MKKIETNTLNNSQIRALRQVFVLSMKEIIRNSGQKFNEIEVEDNSSAIIDDVIEKSQKVLIQEQKFEKILNKDEKGKVIKKVGKKTIKKVKKHGRK